ncbi:heavy-metal-associated domain-containing protein [Pigmentiphaga aceris]|uniref:Heavy-metal-associated domain-containing protein n=1 Tax=Pigmentiphaga aceris TaxID=1940612 RepID=A0A5C0B4A7_9BURK|nr:heavy metal-associated domain-containing protein [Pigmentiphaga aceris]QEI08696.1 heavy-metal-associated domain-containing protein [Pigmentiphaga aceris]
MAQTTVFNIKGITCEACVRTLSAALYKVPGVQFVLVDQPNARATVQYDEQQSKDVDLAKTIVDTGYEVV